MQNSSSPSTSGRVWYYTVGILSVLAGIVAMARPGMASLAITQIVGIFCVISGAFLLLPALFGKTRQHRLFDIFASVLRIVLGVLILGNIVKGMLALTLMLAAVFLAEGIYSVILGIKLRGRHPAWGWVVSNGVIAMILGGMLLAKFPSDSAWAVGLLFGINVLFLGVSMIMFAAGLSRASDA